MLGASGKKKLPSMKCGSVMVIFFAFTTLAPFFSFFRAAAAALMAVRTPTRSFHTGNTI